MKIGKKTVKVVLVVSTVSFMVLSSISFAASTDNPTLKNTVLTSSSVDCDDLDANLEWWINEAGEGMVRNVSTGNCRYKIGLASYEMYNHLPNLSTQRLYDSDTYRWLEPGQSVDLEVAVPDCMYQLDLFTGGVRTPPTYGGNLLAARLGGSELCGGATPTPTPTSTPTPTIGELTGYCSNDTVYLNWTSDSRANSNGLQKGDSFPNDPQRFWWWLPTTYNQRSFVDHNIVPGVEYWYRVKYRPELPSNIVKSRVL